MKLSDITRPRSDQMNAEDFLSSSKTFTISGVKIINAKDQPMSIFLNGDTARPYKPNLSMRKILEIIWGDIECSDEDTSTEWNGRHITLFRDPDVEWSGKKEGGIVISHLSGMTEPIKIIKLQSKRGKKKEYTIKRLDIQSIESTELDRAAAYLTDCAANGSQSLRAAWGQIPAPLKPKLKAHLEALKPHAEKIDAQNAPAQGFTPAPERVAVVEPEPPQAEEPPPITEEF